MAAYLDVRERRFLGDGELLDDPGWSGSVDDRAAKLRDVTWRRGSSEFLILPTMPRRDGRRSRLRVFERDVELELEPLATSDAIGLVAIFASLCVVSCGGVMFYGSDWSPTYDPIGWVGLALIVGGGVAFWLIMWLVQPHKAVKHASHRLRFHARKLRRSTGGGPDPSQMTEAQFDALEDEVDRALPTESGDR